MMLHQHQLHKRASVGREPSSRPCPKMVALPKPSVQPQAVATSGPPAAAATAAAAVPASGKEGSTHGNASVLGTGVTLDVTSKANKATKTRNIVFLTSEVTPWSKTGGLADVCSSLPLALAARGHRVMVVSPRYKAFEGVVDTGVRKKLVEMTAEVGFFHTNVKGVDFVFVDHPSYMRPGGFYADQFGPYSDNRWRFSLLALAGLEAPLMVDFKDSKGTYGQDCVFVANDWHTALTPVYLAAKYRPHGVYTNARSLLAIHNLAHQGVASPSTFDELGLPGAWYGAVEFQYPPHQRLGSYAEEGRSVNLMKAGITTADRLVTVSPGYAEEIQTYLGGWGMENVLMSRAPVLNGIVNGIDIDDWNPKTDKHLPVNYDITNFDEGKRQCKMKLQEEMGLPVNGNIPLIAFIGRLDPQKGADILLGAAPQLLDQHDVQLICLGSGAKDLEDGLRWLEGTYRSRARAWVGFNEAFSHKLTAAADIVVMPSRFEPCGLNQLYAMRYGSIPVAHKTGGLKDTVIDFDPWTKKGTGWTYTNCDAGGLVQALSLAITTYKHHREDFKGLQRRGMERDASWDVAAQQWEQLFEWALVDPPYCR